MNASDVFKRRCFLLLSQSCLFVMATQSSEIFCHLCSNGQIFPLFLHFCGIYTLLCQSSRLLCFCVLKVSAEVCYCRKGQCKSGKQRTGQHFFARRGTAKPSWWTMTKHAVLLFCSLLLSLLHAGVLLFKSVCLSLQQQEMSRGEYVSSVLLVS